MIELHHSGVASPKEKCNFGGSTKCGLGMENILNSCKFMRMYNFKCP